MSWCKHQTLRKVGRTVANNLITVTYQCVTCKAKFTETKQLTPPPSQEPLGLRPPSADDQTYVP